MGCDVTDLKVRLRPKLKVVDFAFYGAVLGIVLVAAHEVFDVLSDDFTASEPFGHIMNEFLAAGLGGALVFAAVSSILNRRTRDI